MKLRRIVLDTNIFISAFLFGGPPKRVINYVIDGSVQCFTSLALLDEIRDVLHRRKFGLSAEQAIAIVEEIHAICRVVVPTDVVRAIEADPDDNRVLECALAAAAEVIVSGDSHLLQLKQWHGMQILDPVDFLQTLVTEQK